MDNTKRGLLFLLTAILFSMLVMSIAYGDEIIVAFEKKEYHLLAGKSMTVKPVIQGTKKAGKFTYTSEDENIATIKNGKVTGVKAGQTVIKCSTLVDGNEYQCEYSLFIDQPVTEIQVLSKEIVMPGMCNLTELPIKILPEDATNKEIEFSSSKSYIAEVNQDGKIISHRNTGTTTITCKAADGSGVKAKFKVKVPAVWFYVDKELNGNELVIDSPEGIELYYIVTSNASFTSVSDYCSNKVIKRGYTSKETLNNTNYIPGSVL